MKPRRSSIRIAASLVILSALASGAVGAFAQSPGPNAAGGGWGEGGGFGRHPALPVPGALVFGAIAIAGAAAAAHRRRKSKGDVKPEADREGPTAGQ